MYDSRIPRVSAEMRQEAAQITRQARRRRGLPGLPESSGTDPVGYADHGGYISGLDGLRAGVLSCVPVGGVWRLPRCRFVVRYFGVFDYHAVVSGAPKDRS